MSGIAGIVHLDGSPVDIEQLNRLTEFLRFRGPDGLNTWHDGHVGFGYTLLDTTGEAAAPLQPRSLGGQIWVVADARIDGQAELKEELRFSGRPVPSGAHDAELILRAYEAWGEDCVRHLIGDFAFAIWDGPRRRLFCARDQMGVKPFFYTQVGNCVVFSNTLDCVRQHPQVSSDLNDVFIADFLLHGICLDVTASAFANVCRLPPAHIVTWSHVGSESKFTLKRYWTLPIEEPLYYRRPDDYVDHFRDLLAQSVGDRIRDSRLLIFMSGGMDSPTLAVTAQAVMRERFGAYSLYAYTVLHDKYDHNERYYSALVADHLGIPQLVRDQGKQVQEDRGDAFLPAFGTSRTPEPMGSYVRFQKPSRYEWPTPSSYSRVFFRGEDPDSALRYEWQPYVRWLWRERRLARLAWDLALHVSLHRRPPFVAGFLRRVRGGQAERPSPALPQWLNPDLVTGLDLHGRHSVVGRDLPRHPLRPNSYLALQGPNWPAYYYRYDAAHGVPAETRHPYSDIRLLRFFLRIPPVPWCRRKYLIRRAMRGLLPQPVLRRKKVGMALESSVGGLRKTGVLVTAPAKLLARYADISRLPTRIDGSAESVGPVARLHGLNYWLRDLETTVL